MKRLKMVLYGEPGVGKSVFASKAPKPFFITTDGNYEWLEEFGADPNAYVQVSSWKEAKKAFERDFSNYETIVVDLTEDLFKWCEHEYCVKNKLEHVSDVGYGKGYDTTRNEFFIEICKLIGLDKHIIFIMHGLVFTEKDRRGVEHTKYAPSNRIPDKLLDMIEGRVRYFLRCYVKAEEAEDKTLIKKRYLSLIPKENEFGIIRGVDENKVPHDIPLDFEIFAEIIGLNSKVENKKPIKKEEKVEKVEIVSETQLSIDKESTVNILKESLESQKEPLKEPKEESNEIIKEEKENQIKAPLVNSNNKELSNEDKLSAIKAKLAALKNQQ